MTRAAAIALTIALAFAVGYLVGLTMGYDGCVAKAQEIFTNRTLRGM